MDISESPKLQVTAYSLEVRKCLTGIIFDLLRIRIAFFLLIEKFAVLM